MVSDASMLLLSRYDGWVTELKDQSKIKAMGQAQGIDNLLYSADAYFSCFADLALTSPVEYYKEGEGTLLQCVITPAAPYMPWTNEQIVEETDRQVGWGSGRGSGMLVAGIIPKV
jgi:zeta-carotene desaturase